MTLEKSGLTICGGEYKYIYRNQIHDHSDDRFGRKGSTLLLLILFVWGSKYYLKTDCAKLKMYTINPKAITVFFKRVIMNKNET